jgi:hypothetical protein
MEDKMAKADKDGTTITGAQPKGAFLEGQDRSLGPNDATGLGSAEPYSGGESSGQLADADPRPSEEDIQRDELGPRGVPGKDDPATMTPQREKKIPENNKPGHTA